MGGINSATGSLAFGYEYPSVGIVNTTTADEFGKTYELFLSAYRLEERYKKLDSTVTLLTYILQEPIHYNEAGFLAPTWDEIEIGLTKIGVAAKLYLQLKAIASHTPEITSQMLDEFVIGFRPWRRFIRLDDDGSTYAIVA